MQGLAAIGTGLLTTNTQNILNNNPSFVDGLLNKYKDLNSLTNSEVQTEFSKFTGNDQSSNYLDKFGLNGYGGLALGVGQLGLGLAGFLDSKKTANLQRDLLKQQYETNKNLFNMQVQKDNDLRSAFNLGKIKF